MQVRFTLGVMLLCAWTLIASPFSLSAQSTGPTHAGYDPNATMGGHYHEGELGE